MIISDQKLGRFHHRMEPRKASTSTSIALLNLVHHSPSLIKRNENSLELIRLFQPNDLVHYGFVSDLITITITITNMSHYFS